MKRISIIITIFLISVFSFNILQASSCVGYVGEYKNEHVEFEASYQRATWFYRRGGRPRAGSSSWVTFKIKAKAGYKILNKTSVIFNDIVHIFKPDKNENYYFKNAEVKIKKSYFRNGSKIKLTYFICKTNDDTCQRIVKKFKIKITRRPRSSHDVVKVKLIEVEN